MTATTKGGKLNIKDCWLFAVASKADLARRLSSESLRVTVDDLNRLAVDSGNFRIFNIRQGSKERPVQEPKRELQNIHTRIHKILSRIETPDYLHSAIKGKSYLTNARAHGLSTPIIKIDVKKFFASVPRRNVFNFFENTLRCRRDVAGLLADLLTFDVHLATGSSASPILAYYAFKPMFDALNDLANRHGLKMTVYVDDITMSGEAAGRSILYEAHQIISKFGLKSHKMRRFSSNTPKIITGVCISPSGERVPNSLHLKIKNGFHDLKKCKSNEEISKVARPLLGRLEAARQIDYKFGARAKTLRAHIRSRHQ